MKLKRILVPVDFSDGSLAALEYAVGLGAPFKTEFALLFVLEPVQFAAAGHVYGGAAPVNVEMLVAEQRRLAEADLARLATRLRRRGARVRTLVGDGPPYRVIVDTAERVGADLVVMGTHGRTGVSRFFMGSVAEMVARHAGCPVLSVRERRPPGKRARVATGARRARRPRAGASRPG
jgi:nucleotide-binding universal stress UspA family protein